MAFFSIFNNFQKLQNCLNSWSSLLTVMAKCSALWVHRWWLKRVKKLSVEGRTLLSLNAHHLGFIEEGEGPPICFQTCENGNRGSCSRCVCLSKACSFLFTFNKTELKSSMQSQQIFWFMVIKIRPGETKELSGRLLPYSVSKDAVTGDSWSCPYFSAFVFFAVYTRNTRTSCK